jgi:cholesterol oxidase
VGRIKYNTSQPLEQRITVEDVSFPLTYVDAARSTFAILIGRDTDPHDFFDNLQEADRRRRDLFALDPQLEKGALNHTLMYLVVGHDDANGRIELDPLTKQSRIRWAGVGNQETFRVADRLMLQHTTALGGSYIQNPSWAFTPMRTLVTVHPLVSSKGHSENSSLRFFRPRADRARVEWRDRPYGKRLRFCYRA